MPAAALERLSSTLQSHFKNLAASTPNTYFNANSETCAGTEDKRGTRCNSRLMKKIGSLTTERMWEVDQAVKVSLGLGD
jgi:hypothetical protein